MKQKCNKKIVINFIILIFVVLFGLCVDVFAQYYYFSSGGNTYQQGCNEVLQVRVNSEGKKVRAGRFHLVLDPLTTIYTQTNDVTELRSFFNASSETFINWTSEKSPSWKGGSDYTILQADRNNGTQDYTGTNKLYANVNFVPVFSGVTYDIVFGMEYISGDATNETTLSKEGGTELIDPEQQNLYRTGVFHVLQEPCVADTNNPTISNISIDDGSTKISYRSGLVFWLKDEGGVNGTGNVPYIKTDGSMWTGNVGGIISNQYGIDHTRFVLELSGNGTSKSINFTTPGVNIEWSGKTWQNNGLNAKFSLSSDALFDFGIEKKITAKFIFYDRAGNPGIRTIHFNSPKGPELLGTPSPANADIYVNLSEPIKLGIKDDWAGVNSGTIKITVKGINGTSYGPFVFSGSDLNLSGVQGSANNPDYYINIMNHENFPTSGTIQISVYAKDMEGMEDSIGNYSFKTRPDCTEFQCCDPVVLNLGNTGATYYYNTGLIISGGNNPTFSVDEQNYTGIIDCNAETEGLSVYTGLDDFVFFTDESELTILGTGIKGVLSGDVLTLSYMVQSSQVIIDKPVDSESLSGGDVDIQWHLIGVENEEDWLSGYVVEVVGDNFETGGFINGTGIVESLPDGEYIVSIYPVDLGGHSGNQTEVTFKIDTTGPDFEFVNRSGYECETGYLEIIGVNDLLSNVAGLPYSFDRINWTGNSIIVIDNQNTIGSVSKTGYVMDILGNISEKIAVYAFIDTGIFVDVDSLDLGMLVPNYTTGIINLLEVFGATEGNCGATNLGVDIISCEKSTGSIDEGNLVINPDPYYEGTGLCGLRISDDDGNIKDVYVSFEIDTKASSCALLLQTSQCTDGEVLLSLLADDASGYNWDGSDTWLPWVSGIITGVNELGTYTGYVVDENGNISGCSVTISTDVLDRAPISANIIQATGYECQNITGYVQVSTGDTCGKNSLDKFMYSWSGADYLNISWTGIYYNQSGEQNVPVSIKDFAGNILNTTVSYRWYDSEITWKDIVLTGIGNASIDIDWKSLSDVRDGDCGIDTIEFSGFVNSGTNGLCTISSQGDIISYVQNLEVQYEGNDICEFEIRDDEGNVELVTITFEGVDTKKPECSISYNESVCTSGSVVLTMNVTGATQYSWTGFTNMVLFNNTYSIARVGIVTGYVKDVAGNTGYCTGFVDTFDNAAPIIIVPSVTDLTVEECTLIEGNIDVNDNGGCGNGFNYSWNGFGSWNDTYYSGYSELVTGKKVTVSVGDSAGNKSSKTLNYHWTDTGVQLINGNEQTISTIVLSGGNSYNTTTGDLILLFGVREGNCGSKYISVEKVSCVGLSMDIDLEGNILVTGNDNIVQTGTCVLKFNDNDGNSSTGALNIKVDTVLPGVELVGTNVACMSTNIFGVTGIFTEAVQGFVASDIVVENGTVSNFGGSNGEYIWQVVMDPMFEVKVSVPAGVAVDFAGNENIQSINTLTGIYDNTGPNNVILVEKTTVYSDNTTFNRGQVSDNGCAGVSGYLRELYVGSCGVGLPIDSGNVVLGVESFDVNGLENGKTYCRRVRPIDNFGNMGNWAEDSFDVDLSSIGCNFVYDANCTSGTLQVTLQPDRDYTINGDIYLSWQDTGDWKHVASLSTGVTFSGQVLTGYIYQPDTLKSNSCVFVAGTIDKEKPSVIDVNVNPVSECTTGTATVSQVSDEGCGQGIYTYSWNGGVYGVEDSFQQYLAVSGTKNINLKVKDNVGNESNMIGVWFMWTDTYITADSFTGSENVGNTGKTVNWRIKSNAIDGNCGSGELNVIFSGFISTGTKGICTRDGDNITYMPNFDMTGSDVCELQLRDDEGNTVNINVYWYGIDTVLPTCEVSYEPKSCVSGSVVLSVTASEAIKQITGGVLSWGITGNLATGNIVSNGVYNIDIKDFAGNNGTCDITINNINTGVLDKPEITSPINGSYTNDNTLDVSWNSVVGNGCRNVSGYQIQILSGGVLWTGLFTKLNNWTSPELGDGNYIIGVKTIDILGGESQWEEINIIVDTKKPTCTIEYNEACTSGNVQLSMMAPEANYYSWIDFDSLSDDLQGIDVNSNGTYYCYVQDFAGNTGMNSIELSNIKTGVLLQPNNLSIVGGTPTSGNMPEFVWNKPEDNGCRMVSGYQVKILSGGETIFDEIIYQTGFTYPNILGDGEYLIKVGTHDSLGGDSTWAELPFLIDTVPPICSIEIITENCVNSEVQIKLSGDSTDISSYKWGNGIIGDFSNNIISNVNENGEYTGYVYDLAGNQGLCTGVVGLNILDKTPISYETHDAIGYECEVITGYVQVSVGETCGKDDLDNFSYLRDGGFTGGKYGLFVDNVSGFAIGVSMVDGAGNIASDLVNYSWQDIGVSLRSGEIQNIGAITGEYTITTGDLIGLFDAEEGLCGKSQVTVTGANCSGANYIFDNGIFTILPDNDLDGVDGYCKFEFSDNEGVYIATGILNFAIDNVYPELRLTGNAVCAKGGTLWTVSGIWSETIQGFNLSDITILNGNIGNHRLYNVNPIYSWSVTSPTVGVGITTVKVPVGVVVDNAGNGNIQEELLSWEYDNVGPNDVIFTNWQDTVFAIGANLSWDAAADSGCAGLSGYNYKFAQGNSCDVGMISDGFMVDRILSVNNLVDGQVYTLCVQPVDNFGNLGNWAIKTFEVDLNAIGCMIEESACSSTGVSLVLLPGEGVGTEGISLSWTGYTDMENEIQLIRQENELGLWITGYIQQISGGETKQARCVHKVSNIDVNNPEIISVVVSSGFECQRITGSVEIIDEGCGSGIITYGRAGGEPTIYNEYGIINSIGDDGRVVYVTGYDEVGNSVSVGLDFWWLDSQITAHDFTGSENVGNNVKTINWKIGSEAIDGACGSGTVYFHDVVLNGEKGTCTGEGDTITYIPNQNIVGNDSCTIELIDDENTTETIIVNWGGIDTEKPVCNLSMVDSAQCTSGSIVLILSSESDDVVGYSFDGVAFGSNTEVSINLIGTYTGYVKDLAGNISEPCNVEITGGTLDLDDPILQVSNWTGYECSTGTIIITGSDDSCGLSGLIYNWVGLDNTGNTNTLYGGNVGTSRIDIFLYDGVGHFVSDYVVYTWQNVPVTGHDFIVENVGTGVTINWFDNGNVSAGWCELEDIVAITNDTEICEVDGHSITYTPSDGIDTGETCTIIVTDGDDGQGTGIEIVITFTGVDTKSPTVNLKGGIGEQCTKVNAFVVTGIFNETVTGVKLTTLTGENVEINSFIKVDGSTYIWEVSMLGGTGKVWIDSGKVEDLLGNNNELSNYLILGNYDIFEPSNVSLISPTNGELSYSNSIIFEWTESEDEGCANGVNYILEICGDSLCNVVLKSGNVSGTGKVEGSLSNGTGYWRVISVDDYENMGVSEIRYFVVNSDNPNCSIIEEMLCNTGNVQLTLTGDKNIEIESSGGVNWNGTGMLYTGEIGTNGEIVVVVKDNAGHTGQCNIPVTQHDGQGPEIIEQIGSVNECEGTTIWVVANEIGCAGISGYYFGEEFGLGLFQASSGLSITADQIGRTGGLSIWKNQIVTVSDSLGNSTTFTGYRLNIVDVIPTLTTEIYEYGLVTGNINNLDLIDILGASEGNCGLSDLSVALSECVNSTGIIVSNNLSVEIEQGFEGNGQCELLFKDNEQNVKTGYVSYYIDTKAPSCVIEYNPGSSQKTNLDVKATLVCSGENGTNWFVTNNSGNNEYNFTEIGMFTFEYMDENGNTGSIDAAVDWIDKDKPVCTGLIYNPIGGTNENVLVRIDTGSCSENVIMLTEFEHEFTNNGIFVFKYKDEAGNTGELLVEVGEGKISWIDKQSPECTVEYDNSLTNGDVLLHMNVVGDAVYYWWNDEEILGSNYDISVGVNGLNTGYVKDIVGNTGYCTGFVDNIDKDSPTINLNSTNVSECTNNNVMSFVGSFSEAVGGFTSDKISVINGVVSDFVEVVNGSKYSWTVLMSGGETTVFVATGVALDMAGNQNNSSNTITSVYDNEGPGNLTMIRPSTNSGVNYGSKLILQWNDIQDNGCVGLSGYVYKVCKNISCSNVVASGSIRGTGVEIEGLESGYTYYRSVYAEDRFGNDGPKTTGQILVDLTNVGCRFEETACSRMGVTLSLFVDGSGTHLSWTGFTDMEKTSQLSRIVEEQGLHIIGYVYDEKIGLTGQCEYTVANIDQINPEIISVVQAIGYECESISGTIEISDEGCSQGQYMYQWNGGSLTGNNKYLLDYNPDIVDTIIYVTGYDAVGNGVSTGIRFVWRNTPIEWHNFTGSYNVGNTPKTVNWRNGADVRDGACGTGTIDFVRFVNTGEKGECTRNGDEITYTPKQNQVGDDSCIIRVEDDEGSTGEIVISFLGVDTKMPECTLSVQEGQQCTSGGITLILNSTENGVAYKFEGDDYFGNNTTKIVRALGVYTGYVKDIVGNVGVCTGVVGTGVLDVDNPTLIVSNWTGYECSTGIVIVTGNDNSCGKIGLNYLWEWFGSTINRNDVYSGKAGAKTVNVTVFDGVGHNITKQVIYTWQNILVTGNNFVVENVGTGIIVNWKTRGSVHAGSCEDVFISSIDNAKCTTGNDYQLIYTPNQGSTGSDTCVLTINDDDGSDTIVVIFEGIDTKKPSVQLLGGVGENCEEDKVIIVTGIFDEQVQGVNLSTLMGENVDVKGMNKINGSTYQWTVEMIGGTGKIWVNSGVVTDLLGNYNNGSNQLVLGNYDKQGPSTVNLIRPSSGQIFTERTISFEWSEAIDEGCSGMSGYILQICKDPSCTTIVENEFTSNTGKELTLSENGYYYWVIISVDVNGNTSTSVTGHFVIDSIAPVCSISQSTCSTGFVSLVLTGNKDISVISGNIVWQKISQTAYSGKVNANMDVRAIVKDLHDKTGYCHLPITHHDNTGPTFVFTNGEGNECETGSLSMVDVDDGGGCAGLPVRAYKFGVGNWGSIKIYDIRAQQPGNIVVTGYIRDNLGNVSNHTAIYTIKDVAPTADNFSIGDVGGTTKTITLSQFIDKSSAVEGNCGTHDLQYSGVKTNGGKGNCIITGNVLTYMPSAGQHGTDSCVIQLKDNENSVKDVRVTFEDIDTVAPICEITQALCTSGKLMLTLTTIEPIVTPVGWNKIADTEFTLLVENTGTVSVVITDLLGNTGSCSVEPTHYDNMGPTFVFANGEGNECETGKLSITSISDNGGCAGLSTNIYRFGMGDWGEIATYEVNTQRPGIVVVTGYVRDSLGNISSRVANYTIKDVIPTAKSFKVSALNGISVNWKELSEARDGACGNTTLSASVTGGSLGYCSISGDVLSYTPKNAYVTGIDTCYLTISDDEGSVVSGVKVEFTDINKYSYVKLIQPADGKIVKWGDISLSWTGVGNNGTIFGFVYRLWSATDKLVVEQTGSNVSIDLRDGSYRWNVYAVFVDGTTGGLSETRSFYVVSSGGNYLLNLLKLKKDRCPDGDLSDSYYDGTCGVYGGTHGSANDEDFCGVGASKYSIEQKGAYLYSYDYGITTMCPIQNANLDGYLIRSHFAKMISEFAVNVLGIKPEKGKAGCDQFDDVGTLSAELRNFVTVSCELSLMGLESNGKTPAKSFNPGNYVTRAQFGTVLSRLLFGDTYNIKDEDSSYKTAGLRYGKHLSALKNYGIMTQIDGDWPNYLERRGWVMIMLQRSDDYGVFAGKVPAKNGISSLFDE